MLSAEHRFLSSSFYSCGTLELRNPRILLDFLDMTDV